MAWLYLIVGAVGGYMIRHQDVFQFHAKKTALQLAIEQAEQKALAAQAEKISKGLKL